MTPEKKKIKLITKYKYIKTGCIMKDLQNQNNTKNPMGLRVSSENLVKRGVRRVV